MFIPMLPLHQTALLSSLSMTSFTLFSNVAGRSMGIVPLINQKYEPFPIEPQQKVKAWNSYFSRAMFWGVGVSVASAGTSFLTAYIHPDPQVRTLSLLSGVASLLIGPITFGSGLPAINSELLALGKQDLSEDEWKEKAARIDDLVRGWEKRHNIRFISYVGGWALSTASLMTALAHSYVTRV